MRSVWLAIGRALQANWVAWERRRKCANLWEKKGKRKRPDSKRRRTKRIFFFFWGKDFLWEKHGQKWVFIHEELFLFQQNFTTDTKCGHGKRWMDSVTTTPRSDGPIWPMGFKAHQKVLSQLVRAWKLSNIYLLIEIMIDLPGGPMAKDPPVSAGDLGLILVPRRFHMPWGN